MSNLIWFLFIFILPAGVANMAPVLVARLPGFRDWSLPMDFGKSWRGKRIFGDNKTWRGFVFGSLAGVITAILLGIFLNGFDFYKTFPVQYTSANPAVFGFLSGTGALIADAVKSFFKRRYGVEPGKSWFPFDQMDYILGAILFSCLYAPLKPALYVLLFVFGFLLHVLVVYIGYLFKIREQSI